MSTSEVLTAAVAIVAGALSGWLTGRRAVGSEALAKVFQKGIEDASFKRHKVVLVAADAALAAALRTTLVQRGFRDVTIAGPDYRGSDAAVVLIARGLDLAALVASAGIAEGLVYTTEHLELRERPPGDWTYANSPISLFARLMELIHWQRSVG